MPLDLSDCYFHGPALPEPFVKFELEREFTRLKLLPRTTGEPGRELKAAWDSYRRKLRALAASGGALRVRNHVIEPLVERLGYARIEAAPEVQTREDREVGGDLLVSEDGSSQLRVWTTAFDEDLYAPSKRGRAYRFSHQRIAQRVLLATGERLGLLTNGVELLLLISDPARPDSTVTVPIDPGWKRSRDVPDSFRFLLALASPGGVAAIPNIVEKARLQQARVTKELRKQARRAVELFIQEIIDHPENREWYGALSDHQAIAKELWREGLITVYRLLFVLKLESSDDAARSFGFASTSLWRNTFSPSMALAGYARDVLTGKETGSLLESGMRTLFRMFEEGLECTELVVKPLGGALFGRDVTPILSRLRWGELAVAKLLDQLLWTTPTRRTAGVERERVHYGPLDVEDLGRVYEALLELEPGISTEPMCRLKRQKLEVVVPLAQGERYRPVDSSAGGDADDSDDEDQEEEETTGRGASRVQWIEQIQPGQFYLRVGLGRKSSGSYYTPHSFVRFLVQETLGPQVAERSPQENPQPLEILKLKVLDPAMGSGHFLVEACRFLGDALYEACRLCDEKALALERRAEKVKKAEQDALLTEAKGWRERVIELPDPDDELLKYLPSRSPEGEETGISQSRAVALCRRLVAVHCLYGVDKNPLAVELAKLALWLESHGEGMPLTFLNHRLIVGDSLTGPFWNKLIFRPGKPDEPIEGLFDRGLSLKFQNALADAIRYVRQLDASVGITVAELREKEKIKEELDRALLPFRVAAAAWSGGVMADAEDCDDLGYADLLRSIAEEGDLPESLTSEVVRAMIARGLGVSSVPSDRDGIYKLVTSDRCLPALSFDLAYPEAFYPTGVPHGRSGFHAVLGNPPWDALQFKSREFFASISFDILDAASPREFQQLEEDLLQDEVIAKAFEEYKHFFACQKNVIDVLYAFQKVFVEGDLCGRQLDLFRIFMERNAQLVSAGGRTGVVVPSAFHANEGATGCRQLYLNNLGLLACYSFENSRQLFDIHRSFKFAAIVAGAGASEASRDAFPVAFYVRDDEWLFDRRGREELMYTSSLITNYDPLYLSFPELQERQASDLFNKLFSNGTPLRKFIAAGDVRFKRELTDRQCAYIVTDPLHSIASWDTITTPDDFILAGTFLTVLKGEDIHQYTERYTARPYGAIDKAHVIRSLREERATAYYRPAIRKIGRSTDERTFIATLLPPGVLCHESIQVDVKPMKRPMSQTLQWLGVFNSFTFDWIVRQIVAATLNLFIIEKLPMPRLERQRRFLSHAVLRLVSTNSTFVPLWNEQLGGRRAVAIEDASDAIATRNGRLGIACEIDAVVADSYGMTRDEYQYVLSTFSHASQPDAPQLCIARFDELNDIGLEEFARKYDPYNDIPLNDNLPKPVIDLPIPGQENVEPNAEGHWEERSGQVTFLCPGPLFDEPVNRPDAADCAGARNADGAARQNGDQMQQLQALITERGMIASSDAREHLNVDAATARTLLQQLVAEGFAVQEGRGRGTRYVRREDG